VFSAAKNCPKLLKNSANFAVSSVYVGLLLALSPVLFATTPQSPIIEPNVSSGSVSPAEEERCRVPEFAKKIGHEEKWKLHNGCQ